MDEERMFDVGFFFGSAEQIFAGVSAERSFVLAVCLSTRRSPPAENSHLN